jgi:thioredoxin-related protein
VLNQRVRPQHSMMGKFLSLVTLFLLVTSGSQAQNKIKWESWEFVNEKVSKGNKKFMVYFYYDKCRWCRVMEESTLRQDQTAKFINNNFYSYRLNALSSEKILLGSQTYTSVRIGNYDFNELAADMLAGNMSFPAVAFLDENFNKINVEEGYTNNDDFEMILSYYAGNHYKKTLFKRFANNYCRDSHFNSMVNNKR